MEVVSPSIPSAPVSTGASVPTSPSAATGPASQGSSQSPADSPAGWDSQSSSPESARDPAAREGASDAERRRWQIKASGRDWDLEEQDLVSYAQKGIDADSKWQEAAKIRQQNNEFLKALRENPRSVLEHPGLKVDLKKLAHEILYEDIENEMMSPEEKEYRQTKRELDRYRNQEQETRAQAEERMAQERDEQYQSSVDRDVRSSISSQRLPLTEFTYDSTIKYMQRAMQAGYRDVTPADVMPYVKRDYQRSQEQMFSMEPDQLMEMIGEKNLERLQAAYIEKIKGKKVGAAPRSPEPPRPQEPARQMSLEEWRDDARRRMLADQ